MLTTKKMLFQNHCLKKRRNRQELPHFKVSSTKNLLKSNTQKRLNGNYLKPETFTSNFKSKIFTDLEAIILMKFQT